MNDPDIWDDSAWELKPGFTQEDADRGEELLNAAFAALVAVKDEGFSRTEMRKFLRDCVEEIY